MIVRERYGGYEHRRRAHRECPARERRPAASTRPGMAMSLARTYLSARSSSSSPVGQPCRRRKVRPRSAMHVNARRIVCSAQLQNGCMCCGFASGAGGNSLLAAIGTLMRAAEARGQVLMAMCAHACAGVRACALSILVGEFVCMHLRARARAGMGQHRRGVQV